jgi:hypothetical protein
MADERVVLSNPVLRLLTTPSRHRVQGGPKDHRKINEAVYAERQQRLLTRLEALKADPARPAATHAGYVLLWVGLDADSQAASHTPDDLFDDDVQARLVAAWRGGYVVEATKAAFDLLPRRIRSPSNAQRCDIFRIEQLDVFASILAQKGQLRQAWELASRDLAGFHALSIGLPAFRSPQAIASVIQSLKEHMSEGVLALPMSGLPRDAINEADARSADGRWLTPAEATNHLPGLLDRPSTALTVGVPDFAVFERLIASGTITRWEPVSPLYPTTPGLGSEPDLDLPVLDGHPIVGVIDGGYHATRYQDAVAWQFTPPLISDRHAARAHGNRVASIVVDGHLWSNQLKLPPLYCKLGIVQAVPEQGSGVAVAPREILNHVEQAFQAHPETHVWNLSANLDRECDEFEVSELGHGLSRLARSYNKLLVVSAGNRDDNSIRVAPPADCEAAIVVGGRLHNEAGEVAGPCGAARIGLGPEGMLKPETSWFSQHRVLGGEIQRGTSYAAPLISKLGAHTWDNLSDPNPDLVKALLIHACDLDGYDHSMGFGTPVRPELPWLCAPNAAVMAWSTTITARLRYYWTGIRVPPSMMKNGRLAGRVKLVAVLEPVVQRQGHHYLSTRLEAGLQFQQADRNGRPRNHPIVGCRNPHLRELDAREIDNKWDPVRLYSGEFTSRNGPRIPGPQPTVQLYARMFWRNTFQHEDEEMRERAARVSFVVSFESPDEDADVYNEFRRIMAENVEAATIEQNIEVDEDSLGD